jgi:hypothetical protein
VRVLRTYITNRTLTEEYMQESVLTGSIFQHPDTATETQHPDWSNSFLAVQECRGNSSSHEYRELQECMQENKGVRQYGNAAAYIQEHKGVRQGTAR